MYCSEYLWKYLDMQKAIPGHNPEREQGELRLVMQQSGDTAIVSDATGKEMVEGQAQSVYGRKVEGQAQSVYGRNMDELLAAYHAGNQAEFARIVTDQLLADEEVEAGKHA